MTLQKKLESILIVLAIAVLPFSYTINHYLSYLSEQYKIENVKQENIVIFYDEFHTDHGEVVVQAFLNTLKMDVDKYKLIKIDNKDVHIGALELLITDLLKEGKKVYLNSSVNAQTGVYSYVWNSVYQHLLEYENMTITQAVGNNLSTADYLVKFTDKNKEIDDEIYTLLNSKSKKIKEIALVKDVEQQLKKYGNYGLVVSSIQERLGFDRNDKMRQFVYETISPIISKYKLEDKQDEIVDTYASLLNTFSFAILITNTNEDVILVGASPQIDRDIDSNSFLDFRVKNLIDTDVRENAIFSKESNTKIGTSISSPIALANIINKANAIN